MAVSILSLIGPKTSPAVKATIVTLYDAEVSLLEAGGWVSPSQAATLTADANTLR